MAKNKNTTDKHIYIPNYQVDKINALIKNRKNEFSKTVCKLIDLGLKDYSIMERLDKLEKEINRLNKMINLMLELQKQTYADLDFDNSINCKDSKPLQEFFKKYRGTNIDD